MKRWRGKKDINNTSVNCEASAYLLGKNFQYLNEENCPSRQRFHYLSDEDEDVSKRFKGFGYPSPT